MRDQVDPLNDSIDEPIDALFSCLEDAVKEAMGFDAQRPCHTVIRSYQLLFYSLHAVMELQENLTEEEILAFFNTDPRTYFPESDSKE